MMSNMGDPDYYKGADALEKKCYSLFGDGALSKSVQDEFDYALKLKTGEVIAFYGVDIINDEWIHLRVKPPEDQPHQNHLPFKADRGVDIRISEIVWVMDAPDGS